MYSLRWRLHAIVTYSLSTLATMTFLLFLSTAFDPYSTDVKLATRKVLVKKGPDYTVSREELDLGVVSFDINANFTDLFNWNVKQIFLYLAAEYQTRDNRVNQVVLWDKIIRNGQPASVNLKNIHSKYYFWDDGNGLRQTPVQLSLRWNVIPNVGILQIFTGNDDHTFVFPEKYDQSFSA